MESNCNILLQSNKVLLFTKRAFSATGYMVYVKNNDIHLYHVSINFINEYGLAGKHKMSDEYVIDNIIFLFIDGYEIKTIKNRNSIEIKDSILNKYRRLLKKYYKKFNSDLNYNFEQFLYNYLHSEEAGLRMNMNSINKSIFQSN